MFENFLSRLYLLPACILLSALLASPANSQSLPSAGYQLPPQDGPVEIYGFKSAIIQYDVISPVSPGIRTSHIDQQGHLLKEVTYRKTQKGQEKEIVIMRGTSLYNLYPEFKIAVKEKIQRGPVSIDVEAMAKELGNRDKVMEEMAANGIQFLEGEEILGNLCQVWQRSSPEIQVTMWAYKGVALRIQVMGKIDKEFQLVEELIAKKIDFDVELDPAIFEIPLEYTIRTRQQLEQGMAKSQPRQSQPMMAPPIQ